MEALKQCHKVEDILGAKQRAGTRMKRLAWSGLVLTLLFVLLTGVVVYYHGNVPWDVAFSSWMAGKRVVWLERVMLAITILGRWYVTVPLTAVMAVTLVYRQRRDVVWGLVISSGLAYVLTNGVKWLVQRPRPTSAVYSEFFFSFPSGHACIAVALYGFIVYCIGLGDRRGTCLFDVFTSKRLFPLLMLIIALGVSRLYLGVHYPSDVVAGYALGGLCLVVGAYCMEKCTVNKLTGLATGGCHEPT